MRAGVKELLRGHRSLLAALAVALVVRLAWILLYPQVGARGDDIAYIKLAESLLAGRGYEAAGQLMTHYMPGWPLVLTIPFGLGLGLGGVRVLLCLISTAICLEAYLLGERLVSRRAGLAAAWFGALFPPLVWYSTAALGELPGAALFGLWAVVAARYARQGGGWGRVAALGLLAGLLIYVRAEMAIMAPIPFLARLFAVSNGWRLATAATAREVARGAAAVALTVALLLPWIGYNYRRFGEVIPLTTAGGMALWYVAHDPPLENFDGPEFTAAAAPLRVAGRPRLTDENFKNRARELIAENPGRYLQRRLVDLPRFWLGTQTEIVAGVEKSMSAAVATRDLRALALKGLGFATQTLFVLTAFGGLVVFARRRELLFPWLIIAAKVAAHAAFVQTTRYSLHIAPLLLCYSGAMVVWILDRVSAAAAARRVGSTR